MLPFLDGSPLKILVSETKPEMIRALRNLETVLISTASRVNALEIAIADKIVMTADAVKVLEARLEKKK